MVSGQTYHVWNALTTSTTGSSTLQWLTFHWPLCCHLQNISYLWSMLQLCQMLTIKGFISWLLLSIRNHPFGHSTAKGVVLITSIWNLDFFWSIYHPFCLHPSLTTLNVMLLDYFIAFYPLLLILLTYWLVKLHDWFRIVTRLIPFYKCFHHFRKEWDLKESLIGAFATFYLLSYVKVLNVTSDMLRGDTFTTMLTSEVSIIYIMPFVLY